MNLRSQNVSMFTVLVFLGFALFPVLSYVGQLVGLYSRDVAFVVFLVGQILFGILVAIERRLSRKSPKH